MSNYRAETVRVLELQAENSELRKCVTERDEILASWQFWHDGLVSGEVALEEALRRSEGLEREVSRLTADRDSVVVTLRRWEDAVSARDQIIAGLDAEIDKLTPKPGMWRRFWAWLRRPI